MRKLALISVSNKFGLIPLAEGLFKNNWNIISTGGTYKTLLEKFGKHNNLMSVEEHCNTKEFLDGRVKTLNETIHGGILAKPGLQLLQLRERGIKPIDMVVANLYPFASITRIENNLLEDAIENIDIGGVAIVRAAAKNYERVTTVTDPSQYNTIMQELQVKGDVSADVRRHFAVQAFKLTAEYDACIAEYLSGGKFKGRMYEKVIDLKYGCNPHQTPAAYWRILESSVTKQRPFEILNGKPSYINFLDALNGWQLVGELSKSTGLPAAASYKHTSPAGAAVGDVPLSTEEYDAYRMDTFFDNAAKGALKQSPRSLVPETLAYVRARNSDPKSSFGDFIALSSNVDLNTARYIRNEVSDGIIAPSFDKDALDLLKTKKQGHFIILRTDDFAPNTATDEFREMSGMALSQQPNYFQDITQLEWFRDVSDPRVKRDILIGMAALKYAQSNSVVIVKRGQVIGLGCGQQNRVDCVKLAGEKSKVWHIRLANGDLLRKWKSAGTKGQSLTNYMYDAIDTQNPELLPAVYNDEPVVLVSDGFFPFADNIRVAKQYHVTHIVQPGGSTADDEIDSVCDKLNITQYKTKKRIFYH